ncbi:glycosyltransferase family protein [Leisingera sp. M658]|uniref:glycosyltransferase family protein n=1 Tax=Leisingera sp. M658 TaxID=2867015 RepID=UPI0021A8E7A3|nr:glycosyltransferase [Leisingera sp. M658]UWQ75348.1 glycosyltransferase [Leisingera sp. M658]
MKVLIAVTHLLGTGHLARALTLARAFTAASHQVQVVSGGFPAPQLDTDGIGLIQLPPLRSDGVDFTRLLAEDGRLTDAAYMIRRQDVLCAALNDMQPDVLITELYPFGRRSLRKEFLALLDAAHALPRRPVILSSIRDILAPPSKPEKADKADAVIARFYDAVLVHSDPAATKLEASWPVTRMLAGKLRYTGYVAPPAAGPHPSQAGSGEVLVSAGGGSVGTPLYQAALDAAKLMPDTPWRLLVGGSDAAARIADFAKAGSPALLEPARKDFRQMLSHAAASVSMCGYNTALDLLQAGTPAVLIPFDAGNETEQGLRAASLAPLNGVQVVKTADLSARTLCAAVKAVLHAPPRVAGGFRFDGAARSVEIAAELAGGRE